MATIRHKKNTAYYLSFPMIDSATPASFKSGVSPADTGYYKDGAGAWTSLAITDTATEIGSTGVYEIDLSAAEMNHDRVLVKFAVTGAADMMVMFDMTARDVDDLAYPTTSGRSIDVTTTGEVGLDFGNVTGTLTQANVGWVDANSRVDIGSWLGTAVTTSATTNKPEVDTYSISDDATAANNAELAFDGTGYGFTGCTIPTVTTLTGHTAQTGDSFARLGAPAGASVSADIATRSSHSALDVWHVATASIVTASTIGLQLKTNVDAVITDRTLLAANYFDPATDTVATVTSVTNAVTVGTINANVITASAIADGAIDAATFAAGAIDAAAIATDAITAAKIAAGAITSSEAPNLDVAISTRASSTALATAQTDLDTLTGADGVLLATSQITGWPANLAASAGQIIKATVDTVTNGHTPTTTEFQADDITEATADHYNGRVIIFTGGALAGQATDITDYVAVGGIGQFTVTALTEAPANNDTFIIV